MPNHYLVETTYHSKETTTTEEGVDTLEEAEAYLNSLGFPEAVIKESIKNLKYGDSDSAYIVKITLLGSSYSNWCSQCRIHYVNTICDLHSNL